MAVDLEKVFADKDFRALPRDLQVEWLKGDPELAELGDDELTGLIREHSVSGFELPKSGRARQATALLGSYVPTLAMPVAGVLEAAGKLPVVGEYAKGAAGRVRNLARVASELGEEASEEYSPPRKLATDVGGGLLGSLPFVMAGGPVGGMAAQSGLTRYGADPDDPARAVKEAGKGALLGAIWQRLGPLARVERGAGVGAAATGLALEHATPEEAAKEGAISGGLAALLGGGRVLPNVRPVVEGVRDAVQTARTRYAEREPAGLGSLVLPRRTNIEPPVGDPVPAGATPATPEASSPWLGAVPGADVLRARPNQWLYPKSELEAAERGAVFERARARQADVGEPPPGGAMPFTPGEPMELRPGESAPLARAPKIAPRKPKTTPVRQRPPAAEPVQSEARSAPQESMGGTTGGVAPASDLLLPGGGKEPVKYELVEADSLIASHRADNFQPRQEYPAGVQERAYHRVQEEQAKVIQNADAWDPRFIYSDSPTAIDGPPIVTPSGVVLGGNSRTMSAQRIAAGMAKTPPERLREVATAEAARFGLDPKAAEGMKAPVIVRRMGREPASASEAAELGRRMNEPFTQDVGRVERGVALAKSLSDESMGTFARLSENVGDDATIRSTLGTDRSFREALERDGIITPQNRTRLVKRETGELTDDGVRLAEDVLLGKILPDADLVDALPGSWRDKLLRSTPAVLRAEVAHGGSDFPRISELLAGAARSEVRRRASGMNLDDFLAQRDLTGEAPSQVDPNVAAVHRVLHSESPLAVRRRLARFASRVEEATSGQATLLGPAPTVKGAFEEAIVGHPVTSPAAERAAAAERVLSPGTRVRVDTGNYKKPKVVEGEVMGPATRGRIAVKVERQPGVYTKVTVRPDQVIASAGEPGISTSAPPGISASMPGWNWVPFRDADLVPPEAPMPRKLVRRSQPLVRLSKALDVRISEGGRRLRSGQGRLPQQVGGYWRHGREVLRIQRWGDIQTAAHEIFHALADRNPRTFGALSERQAQRQPFQPIDAELHSLSYDVRNAREGYAEAGRLWFTNRAKLEAAAPLTYATIERAVNALPRQQRQAMRTAQREMHDWFAQGAKASMESKVGPEPRELEGALTTTGSRIRQHMADAFHGVMEAERKLWGSTQPDGPTELVRRLRGVPDLANFLVERGTLKWVSRAGGDLEIAGPGMREIIQPVLQRGRSTMRAFWRYAIARQANELAQQGRERLYTAGEIAQGLAESKAHPEFRQVFERMKTFQSQVADFAQSSGLFSQEMRDRWAREEYAFAFFRELGKRQRGTGLQTGPMGIERQPVRSLRGSTRNLRHPLDSAIEGPARLLQLSFENLARGKIASDVIDAAGGGRYGQRIQPESVPTVVSREKLIRALDQEHGKLGLAQFALPKADIPQWLEVMTLWDNVKPHGDNIMTVLKGGKPTYYEVFDPQLVDALHAFRRPEAVPWVNALRRLKQSAITLDPAWMYANSIRDLPMALISTKTGTGRFIKNAARGYWSAATRNDTYYDFLLHGGGGATHRDQGLALQSRLLRESRSRLDPRRTLNPLNLFRVLDRVGRTIELGPRLTEFIGSQQLGHSKGHAAFLGREITTDFAQHGKRSGAMGFMQDTIPFFNAMTQSMDRVYRLAARDPSGKLAFATKAALVPLFSLGLYSINRSIPEYRDLPDHERDLYWHYFIPKDALPADVVKALHAEEPASQRSPYVHLKQPKFWEVGSLGSIAERAMAKMLEDEPELGEDVLRLVARNFGLEVSGGGFPVPLPVIAKEGVEQFSNRDLFTGSPIVPSYAEKLPEYLQLQSRQGPTMEAYGQAVKDAPIPEGAKSPARAEAVLRSMLGAFAGYGLEVADRIVAEAGGEPKVAAHWDENPMLRRLYARPQKHSRAVDEYYDLRDELAPKLAAARKALELGRPELVDETQRGELRAAQALEKADEALSGFSKKIRMIRRGSLYGELTPEQRRDAIEALERRKQAVMRRTLKLAEGQMRATAR